MPSQTQISAAGLSSMADTGYRGALLAGLAWLPWSKDLSADCHPEIAQFFQSLGIDASMALDGSFEMEELSEWLKEHFGQSHREKVHWFEVGVHTMIASSMFAGGATPEDAKDALASYRAVLQEAGVSVEARDRIGALVRELGLAPHDRQIFARLLEVLEEQSRLPSTSPFPRPNIKHWAAASYCLTVAVVIIIALAAFSKNVTPFALSLILAAGLVLTTAIGGFGALRD
jgi:hypothetical protein